MPVNHFDQAARYAARRLDPHGFFAWVAPGMAFLHWRDTRSLPFPGGADRVCDTVAELSDPTHPGRRWLVVVEFQAEPDPLILPRLLEYAARLLADHWQTDEQRQTYQVATVLFNLTGPAQEGTLEMVLPTTEDAWLGLQPVLRTLSTLEAAPFLADLAAGRRARCLLPWVVLMRGADLELEGWKQVALTEPDRHKRADYGGLALTFADLVDQKPLWTKALKGWAMKQSSFIQEFIEEGRKEGREEGREEGIELGEVRGQRKTLLQMLHQKFTRKLPKAVTTRIEGEQEATILTQWISRALNANTLAEFRQQTGI